MLFKRFLLSAVSAAVALAPMAVSAPALAYVIQVQDDDREEYGGPRLVVTVVVDQLSANLFNQYRSRFTGGFKRLIDEGLVHANGFQTHGITETCPGHSTVLTGMHPTHTGIGVNFSNDDETGEGRYCLASKVNTLAHGKVTDNGNVGTELLKVDTLGDWLQLQHPESRVFAVSGKDRGAMNLAGHNGRAFWFTNGFGLTTYVRPDETAEERLAPVAAFNARYPAAEQGQNWKGNYAYCQSLAEDIEVVDGTFKSVVPPQNIGFDGSPTQDEETLKAATYLLQTQRLGQGKAVDMLGVSLSATDKIGHTYGTQGPEMCEQLMRLDAALGDFLSELEKVEGGVVLALTADHGGADIIERTSRRGFPYAHRASFAVVEQANAALRQQFNLDFDPLQRGSSGLRIVDTQKRVLPEPLRSRIARAAVPMLDGKGDFAMVVFRDELLQDPVADSIQPEELTVRERLRLSAVAGVSADLITALKPGVATGGRLGGNMSAHGQPWNYDRRVPIIFWTPDAKGQERFMPIRTIDIAPTLANIIQIDAPKVDGRCVNLDLGEAPTCPVE
ncbi:MULTISPECIES: alkaline phosphatase family protein [unclassified Brevundimonas]|uniref:alkaline phosphatase family protein n=1 Tax=unclassified Brevundimonas TaxID=2622653 RepID=UPI0025C189CD|nr:MULTISPECIES: alkaline phosphatase family protein [unclassified Brevundimonas]